MTIALNGTLGAGKTQFVRFFAEALGAMPENVTSPTYVLHQQYVGRTRIHHFDFYRLEHEAQVWDLGFDEVVESEAIILVEWARKFARCMPDDFLEVNLAADSAGVRSGEIVVHGELEGRFVESLTGALDDWTKVE